MYSICKTAITAIVADSGETSKVYTALTWRHKERLRYDETFLLLWGKCRVTPSLVGMRCVERFGSQFLI